MENQFRTGNFFKVLDSLIVTSIPFLKKSQISGTYEAW